MEAFAKMPVWLFQYPIKATSKLVYCYLLNEKNIMKSEFVRVSISNIAKRSALNRKTVGTSLKELEQCGLIEVERCTETSSPLFAIKDSFPENVGTMLEENLLEENLLEEKLLEENLPKLQENFTQVLGENLPKHIHSNKNISKNIKEYSCAHFVHDKKNNQCANEIEYEKRGQKKERTEYSGSFLKFWDVYPKKRSKADAYKAWKQMHWNTASPSKVDALIQSVRDHVSSCDWAKDGGKYIPLPAGYLRRGMWEDDVDQNSGTFQVIQKPSYDTSLFKQKAVGEIKYRKRDTS